MNFLKKIYIHVLLIFIIFFPHNNSIFNGIPFTSIEECILILFIFPLFYLLKYFKNITPILKIFLIIILFLKLTLIATPKNGILIKQYFNANELKNDKYIKTFNSFWNPSVSAIQNNDWKNKKNFPIDWNFSSKINIKNNNSKYLSSEDDFKKISLIYKINFWILLKEDSFFKLTADGIDRNKSNLFIVNKNTKEQEITINQNTFLKKGIYEINGIIKYGDNNNWSLYPGVKIKNQSFNSAFKEQIVFASNIYKKNNFLLFFSKNLGQIFDVFLIFFFLAIFFINIKKNTIPYLFSLNSIICFFLIYQVYSYFNFFKFDQFGSTTLSINIFFNTFIILYFFYKKNNYLKKFTLNKIYLLYITVPTLIFFFIKYFSEINSVREFSYGDDWDVFHEFARRIVIDKEWLLAGEPIFYFRPLIRYVYAVHYILFGNSVFAHKITEAWSIILISYYTFLIGKNLKINIYVSLFFSSILLCLYLGDNFRWLIGRGLPEYYAAALIMFTAYWLGNSILSISKFTVCVILGVLGCWLREDHGILLVSLIFFIPNNLKISLNENFFKIFIFFIKKNFYTIFLFGFFITSGFLLMFVRNYYLSGDFAFLTHPNLAHITTIVIRDNFSIWSNMFFGINLTFEEFNKSGFYKIPKIYSIFLIGGFILSLISLWRIRFINYNFSLSVAIFSILLPYLYLNNIGYAPRYTIHYLPFCILIVSSYLTYLINKEIFFKNLKII